MVHAFVISSCLRLAQVEPLHTQGVAPPDGVVAIFFRTVLCATVALFVRAEVEDLGRLCPS